MYNHALDTFVRAAELGSFSKVAEESYISPSAVIQQINHLEGDLNVRLFNRSKKGVTLTPAGKYFFLESKALIQRSNDIRTHLATYTDHSGGTVLFGSNSFHMPSLIYDYWPGFASSSSDSTLSSYSFSESGIDIRPDTDLVEGIFFHEPIWQNGFTFHHLKDAGLAFLVSEDSILADHRILTEVDLQKYTVVGLHRGVAEYMDAIADDLRKSGISVEEVEIYSTSVLIDCLEADRPLIVPDCWNNLHPYGKIIPYIHEYKCPYGFFVSKNASVAARKFMNYLKSAPVPDRQNRSKSS